ncbi:hypothetical protein PV332_10520 [Streptomyces scabiei]|uniref:hypothetical protein n=1 Tax=Streptomyces scabiei TaxID=1930 RepID=UPI0029BEFBCC|nr:hypothetical protein [Streptomyces scabiei]MDX2575914.1 hypothetical protein [Streptomyces scabiei]MDX2885613.1 hypothetical protein [Streptomyces scabiei]MDX2993434.1 hypothetical protein [Streptomyces scabiei]MDX3028452.1 hypothetical protein [Streptomyces scabiei]MDX3047214.1 hypothetical protein [Streptomyces scabiei]
MKHRLIGVAVLILFMALALAACDGLDEQAPTCVEIDVDAPKGKIPKSTTRRR